jgi:hypothetical protein
VFGVILEEAGYDVLEVAGRAGQLRPRGVDAFFRIHPYFPRLVANLVQRGMVAVATELEIMRLARLVLQVIDDAESHRRLSLVLRPARNKHAKPLFLSVPNRVLLVRPLAQ